VTSSAFSISFALVLGVSVLKSTVTPFCFTSDHHCYLFIHFLPLLSTSYA
jgi:hypothetical protein